LELIEECFERVLSFAIITATPNELCAELQRGTGIIKTARLVGTGVSAVQRIKRELGQRFDYGAMRGRFVREFASSRPPLAARRYPKREMRASILWLKRRMSCVFWMRCGGGLKMKPTLS
jgi:hypothetical protein